MRAARERGHQLPRRRPLQRRDRNGADPDRLLRGAVRRAVPRRGLAARRDDRVQQAVVGVLARAERGRGARRVARAHGPRLHRRHLRRTPPPDGLPLEQMVRDVARLIAAGKARAWAIVNWPADQLLAAVARSPRAEDVPQPCAAQLAYSLVHRSPVEDDDMRRRSTACGAPVVASYVLAGGVLSGKYDVDSERRAGPREHSTSPCTPRRPSPPVAALRHARAARHEARRAGRRLRAREPRRRDRAVRCDPAGADRARTSPRSSSTARLTDADWAELDRDRDADRQWTAIRVMARQPARDHVPHPLADVHAVIADPLVEPGDQRELHRDEQLDPLGGVALEDLRDELDLQAVEESRRCRRAPRPRPDVGVVCRRRSTGGTAAAACSPIWAIIAAELGVELVRRRSAAPPCRCSPPGRRSARSRRPSSRGDDLAEVARPPAPAGRACRSTLLELDAIAGRSRRPR